MMPDNAIEYGESLMEVSDITGSLVIREGNLSLITEQNGNIPLGEEQGLGLYHRDCRFLSGYVIRLNGRLLTSILSSDEKDYASTIVLTNRDFTDNCGRLVRKNSMTIRRDRVITGLVEEHISIINHNQFGVDVCMSQEFDADFNDIFTIRGITRGRDGTLAGPVYENGDLRFSYHGKDGHTRNTRLCFDQAPECRDGHTCYHNLHIEPSGLHTVRLRIFVEDTGAPAEAQPRMGPGTRERLALIRASYAYTLECCRKIGTDNLIFNKVFQRSMADLRLLNMSIGGHIFHSAGVPWYDALFGRDSIIAAIQSMPYELSKAKSTLRLLARYQGKVSDDWRDEEPGKILHELRVGEKANLGEIPMTPYYGTVDATPLYLILLADYLDWTGEIGLLHELMGNVRTALDWMDNYADPGGTGFASYVTRSKKGLANQGWKDSPEGVSRSDGSLATHPVALAEVQGYFYLAKVRLASFLERAGDRDLASRLIRDAHELKRKFNREFWMSEKGYYAQAIDRDGLCDVISSNPLQCLWAGIVDSDRAATMVKRAFEPDMFSGWGIRTLSSDEKRYSPLGYHTGTIWPFDNSIIAVGLRRYGFREEADRLLTCMYDAASHYPRYRLPELFGGYRREDYSVPVRYPVACSPQAWSAGTIPYMLSAALGFIPRAIDRRLTLMKPSLPGWMETLKIDSLMVGDKPVDLEFRRIGDDTMVNEPGVSEIDVVVHY
ncbi:MAG: Amylo-alpha-1,6-glucosidase [Methanocella sp. PtaU1.Bin125]|nr:MAG: Amylo-alpha-1,6-glucosidase [Methanocella sp. PtaU1.Bin125]